MNTEASAPLEPGHRRVPRILLVDDEAMVRETLAAYLSGRLNVEMRTAASCEAALEQLGRESFDIVLADHAMPGMSGLTLMCKLRQDYPKVARVMVTGHREPGMRDAAEQFGAVHAFVRKPYSLRQLVKLLQALVDDPSHMLARRRFS